MARRNQAQKREVLSDYKYNDKMVTKFINAMMKDGKKAKSEKIFYDAMEQIKVKTGEEGVEIFRKALLNVKPSLEVKSRRIGGATYQIPIETSKRRGDTLAVRWLVKYAIERKEYTMVEKLTNELIASANKEGTTFKKKEDTHKMAEANRAFAHYRY